MSHSIAANTSHFPYPYGSDVNERPYVQTRLKLAVMLYERMGHCKLNENIWLPKMDDAGNKIAPVFDGLDHIFTGLEKYKHSAIEFTTENDKTHYSLQTNG
ncbi:hypothetical protein CXF86_11275 [Shewanella sp. GutCb]|uniref:hypothetical protein n=1 Tax=Shewanella sp. GutCb TaxID=2058315 RepID=UPI000C7D41F2|nr:hypothetical protein [Shewanella sp. GutCb]PKG74614.1 hypothetical protein CXF86_11275 [Shewanella sp. GutCb]